MNAEEVARALGGARKCGTAWMARCPAHDDLNPSLRIEDQGERRLFLKCFANCTYTAVLDACRARGISLGYDPISTRLPDKSLHRSSKWRPLQPVPADAPPFNAKELFHKPCDHRWDYLDAKGRLLGYVVRFDGADGAKEIRPAVFCENSMGRRSWRSMHFPNPRPLYGLLELATRPLQPVLIVEGEKACCAARGLVEGYVCITWPGGANAVGCTDWSPLRGRKVTIWPDADAPGVKAATTVLAAVLAIGATSAHTVELPSGLPTGWDLADPLPNDINVSQLMADANSAQRSRLADLNLQSASALMSEALKEPKWAVPDLLPEGAAMLAGKPKTGKSFLALDLALAVAMGGAAIGATVDAAGSALYLALEDTHRRLRGRLDVMLQDRRAPDTLDIATEWKSADEGGVDDIRLWLEAHPDARLVVVDTLARIRGRSERNESAYQNDVRTIVPFKQLADQFGVTILIVHHLRKEKSEDPLDSISGTGGLSGALDTLLILKRNPSSPYAVLYVRGRDVREQEISLRFNEQSGCWLTLGPNQDFRRSPQRRQVLSVLNEAGRPLKPHELAKLLGKNLSTTRSIVHRLVRAGDLVAGHDGSYQTARGK